MRRVPVVLVCLVLLAAACTTDDDAAFAGFRDAPLGQVLRYSVLVDQTRSASGLGATKELPSRVRLELEEEALEDGRFALLVRDVGATGEASQRAAAHRLRGRRVVVDPATDTVQGMTEAFSGSEDIAAADVALLWVLLAPVLRDTDPDAGDAWRTATPSLTFPWAQGGLVLSSRHAVHARETLRRLDVARVSSDALGNARFRLPIVRPAASGQPPASGGSRPLIVNELFESLFADIDNPVQGFAAAIAAIPLAVAAPFLAIGEALGGLFGSGRSQPSRPAQPAPPVLNMSGPIQLDTATALWTADGRVLGATGSGTLKLGGDVPDLGGGATSLSGKRLSLDTSWRFERTLTSPWPEPREPPGRGIAPVAALVALAAAVAAVAARRIVASR